MEEGEVAEGSNGEEKKAEQGQLEIAPGNEGGLLHTEDLAKTAGVSERHSENSAETPKCFEGISIVFSINC